jgi:hypothetical protein
LAFGVLGQFIDTTEHDWVKLIDVRLAGLPKNILDNAQRKADQLKIETDRRLLASMARRTEQLLGPGRLDSDNAKEVLRNASLLYKNLSRLSRS